MTGLPLDPAPPRPRAQSLSCPSCGAAIALHAQGWAVTVVCGSCGAVLDAMDPNLRVLQRQADAIAVTPQLPLGTRGTWHGVTWELIGFQVVTITVEGTDYSWTEYVAFNPFRGFLYLSEYQGHWNVIEKLRRRPRIDAEGGRPVAHLGERTFKHFQTATARTTLALGEFPWQLQVGDTVVARDFIAPPHILSAEASDGETTWSMGTYTPPDVIAKAFGQDGRLSSPVGVFANQPNPNDVGAGQILRRLGLFLVLLVAMLFANIALSRGAVAYTNRFAFVHGTDDSSAFVTPAFVLDGRPSSVTVDIDADLENDWIFLDFTLIDEASGIAREFSQQVSYYHGRDSDGNWSEGSRHADVRLASVPAGRYFLRVAPEGGEATTASVNYVLRVRRDVPSFGFYLLALGGLLVPAFLAFVTKNAFESRRWAESDYGSATGSASSDDDDSGDDE
ncbi:MAG: DUF4178 domain-containing protein [Gemmatimonadaceae bacterium]|nr:DUF4178 domain-containing protein [Gemmatimonadaceae bacterium]